MPLSVSPYPDAAQAAGWQKTRRTLPSRAKERWATSGQNIGMHDLFFGGDLFLSKQCILHPLNLTLVRNDIQSTHLLTKNYMSILLLYLYIFILVYFSSKDKKPKKNFHSRLIKSISVSAPSNTTAGSVSHMPFQCAPVHADTQFVP